MKKVAIFLPVLLMITLILSGCSKVPGNTADSELYSVFICDCSDSLSSASHKIEYEFADYDKYANTTTPNHIEFVISGEKYVGDYQSSQYIGYNYFPVHTYIGSGVFSFELDESGNLSSCFWGKNNPTGKNKTQAECLEIAKKFLANIVDISKYKITVEDNTASKLYTIRFTKRIDGINTTDSASVVVDYEGNLYNYSSFMLGRFDTDTISLKGINLDKVKESVNNKLNQVYKESKSVYSRVEYGEIDITLTLLKDGTVGAVCTVDVKGIESSGEFEIILSERICFVVIID